MTFKLVGKGNFTKEHLTEYLMKLGIENPHNVISEAEKGRAICGAFRILAVK